MSDSRTDIPNIGPANRAPGQPSITRIIAGDGQVTLEWDPPTDTGIINGDGTIGTITGYNVYINPVNPGDDSPKKASMGVGVHQVVIGNLINWVGYRFTVTGINATGEGMLSTVERAIPFP